MWRYPFPGGKGGTPVLQGSPGRAPSSPDWGPSRPLLLLRSALTPQAGQPASGASAARSRLSPAGPGLARAERLHADVGGRLGGATLTARPLASHGGPAVFQRRERAAPTGLLRPEASGVFSSLPPSTCPQNPQATRDSTLLTVQAEPLPASLGQHGPCHLVNPPQLPLTPSPSSGPLIRSRGSQTSGDSPVTHGDSQAPQDSWGHACYTPGGVSAGTHGCGRKGSSGRGGSTTCRCLSRSILCPPPTLVL